jgi:hypothetical protein
MLGFRREGDVIGALLRNYGTNFKGQESKFSILEDGTDRLSRNVGKE